MLVCQGRVVVVTGLLVQLVTSHHTGADVLTADIEPVTGEERIDKNHVLLGGGALAAGAGLAWLQNYYQNKPSSSPSSVIHRYPSTSYYYKPQTSPYYTQYPSSQYYQQRPHQYRPQQQPHYQQHQYPQYYHPGYSGQYHQPQSAFSQIHSAPSQHVNTSHPLVPGHSPRKLSHALAGGAGVAAGYWLLNKYKDYKNSQTQTYHPVRQYYYSQPHYYNYYPYHGVPDNNRPGFVGCNGRPDCATIQESRILNKDGVKNGLLLGGLGLGGYYLYNKYNNYVNQPSRPVYHYYHQKPVSSYPPPHYYQPHVHRPYHHYAREDDLVDEEQQSYIDRVYHSIHVPHRVGYYHATSNSDDDQSVVNEDLTCVPVYQFSLLGNHYYKCQGRFQWKVHPINAEI